MAQGSQNVKAVCPKYKVEFKGFSSSVVLLIVAYEKCALTAEESSFQWEDFLAHQVM